MNKLITVWLICLLALPTAWAEKMERVSGKVVKVDAERGKVTLNHAPIKSINMAAMTMPFKVKDSAMLKTIKPGDKVWFSVAMQNDELLITQLQPDPAAGAKK